MPSLATCGPAGGACVTCDPKLADHCDPQRGGCVCGAGAGCQAGQQCVNGACVCNAQTCLNGCCGGGNTCFIGVNCATCSPYHKSCTRNTDCCSNNCVNGTCQVPVGNCLLANNACTKNGDCCSGHCDLDVDGKMRCSLPNQCKGVGLTCAEAVDCCTLYCDPMTLKCAGGKVCKGPGTACMANVECCSNLCSGGACVNNGKCPTLGDTCSGNNCCSGSCIGGHCTWDDWCRSGGDVCDLNAQCCDGVCDTMGTHRCDAVTQCVPTNEPCTGLRSCCNTLCVDNGLGIGVGFCYPLCGCRSTNDVCAGNGSCCSGKCGPPDTLGLRRCSSAGNCLADGEVCGGNGASQNCCNGGKASCVKTHQGASRCNPTMMCLAAGAACSLCDQCCSGVCIPDANSQTGFSCGKACIPLNMGTCTSDSDCCPGGTCQAGICVPNGQTCVPLGGPCNVSGDCCQGACNGGFCQAA
jgi:hypothetical protein